MNIEEYIQFRKMSESPPKELEISKIHNVKSQQSEDEYDYLRHKSDVVGVALEKFFDGETVFPHIWTGEADPYNDILGLTGASYALDICSVDKLMKMAQPAPFGDLTTGETSIDTEVRHCYQIVPDAKVRVKKFPKDITEYINDTLYPNRKIDIVFNKLNIYPVGGHFKRHVDTPKPNVIGTVVVFGQQKFEGGDLVICDDGKERRYSSDIVAFYSNMPHWVEPVTSGTRVTATYYIMQKDSVRTDTKHEPSSQALDVKGVLLEKPFGIVLSETYSTTEDMVFKGDDIKLQALLEYFTISYLPVLLEYRESYYGEVEYNEYSATIYRCTPDDFKTYQTNGIYKELKYSSLPCYVIPGAKYGGYELGNFTQNYIDHVGNECQEGIINNTYFSRLVIFTPKQNP